MKLVQPWCLSLAVMLGVGAFTMITPRPASADVIIHIGADVAPAPNPIVYHYVYYPEEEAYFVPETHIYWWNVGGEWRSGPHVPDGIVLGASVNLDVDGREPWRHHEVIVKRYPRHQHEEKREEKREEKEEKHDDKR